MLMDAEDAEFIRENNILFGNKETISVFDIPWVF
jgi:hypothetical protein